MRSILLFTFVLSSAGCLGSALAPSNGNGSGGGTGSSGGSAGGTGTGSGSGGGTGSSGGVADMSVDPVALFNATVAPIVTPACSACHGKANGIGPSFMVPTPDILTSMLAFPGLIGDVPEDSMLLTKGNHEGPAFTPAQQPVVHDWIVAYNASKMAAAGGTDAGVTATGPLVKPFAPSMTAANSVDLSLFNAKLVGTTMSFTAKQVGTSIQLSAITLTPSATVGIHVVHPIFTIYDATGKTGVDDPIDSFSGLDQSVPAATPAPLGPGTLVLANFAAGSLISVRFDKAEPASGTVTVAGCKALAMFVANVKPLLQTNCNSCHVGNNPTSGLGFDVTPDAQLCANALSEINPTTPAMSNLLIKPDPSANGDAAHPKKINPFTAYQTAVTNWINAEK